MSGVLKLRDPVKAMKTIVSAAGIHGWAPDIAAQGVANSTATIRSAALMLEHMGMGAEAQRLDAAMRRVYRDGRR